MQEVTYTLLTDGTSDKTLIQIINWLFNDLVPHLPVQHQFADLSRINNPPAYNKLDLRIKKAIELYPCNVIFVHRDSEKSDRMTFEARVQHIQNSFNKTEKDGSMLHLVKVIPVRMTETWLMIDKNAIKIAAGNRHTKETIDLPPINKLESYATPKQTLHSLIKKASGLKGRRLDKLNIYQAVHIVAENILDFAPLRQLNAFRCFEKDLKKALFELNILK